MNPVECLLKSENFSVAARLDPLSPDAQVWLQLAAAWRMRATEERCGSALHEGHCLFEKNGEVELWNAITEPRQNAVVRPAACQARAS
jgi:hypothetical protein